MIIDEFKSYLTVDGFACNAPQPPGTMRGCDNEPMFTAEMYTILWMNRELVPFAGRTKFYQLISKFIGSDGYLHRAPGDPTLDEIDDHLGVLSAIAQLQVGPQFKLPLALYRFPQLVYAWLLHKGVPSLAMFPLTWITALIIGTSCISAAPSDTDSRRLNWHLWKATEDKSILCSLAGKFWHWRQKKVYKTQEVMKAVAAQYYLPQGPGANPYAKYWID